MITMKSVCLGCPDRFPGCHGICKVYLEAKRELEEKKDKIKEQKMRDRGFDDYRFESIRRAKNPKRM